MPKPTPNALVAAKADFHAALHGWYRDNARALPWRDQPSLYKTVVSEFMLQQTQVKTVLPYFARWMKELPDFNALAAASEARVLKLWEGLGYYSRARNLHRLAQEYVARRPAPRTPDEWRTLPGVGPYTAAAITSIAFGEPAACVDGNVVRILARLTGDDTECRDSATAAKRFAPLAQALVSTAAPGDHNQAMMELGATVCVRQKPACLTCPVRSFCVAGRSGDAESLPRLAPKRIEARQVARVWCEKSGALLLHRAAAQAKRFANIHELPLAEHIRFDPATASPSTQLLQRRRTITRFQITETVYRATPPRGTPPEGLVWVALADLGQVTLSGPHRRWVSEILTMTQPG